jgi:MFS family permease
LFEGESVKGFDRSVALTFVVLLGVVSLLADVTYEGARSAVGPYLEILGASAAAVGVVAGLGELVGYAIRVAAGYLSDRTGRYWAITIAGYGVNLLAVPLLALAGRWEVAAALIVFERLGKAIRTPARDAMLSHATHSMGRGWGFGLHEALDQIGAVLGPLIVAAVLYFTGDYRAGFAILLVPASPARTTRPGPATRVETFPQVATPSYTSNRCCHTNRHIREGTGDLTRGPSRCRAAARSKRTMTTTGIGTASNTVHLRINGPPSAAGRLPVRIPVRAV